VATFSKIYSALNGQEVAPQETVQELRIVLPLMEQMARKDLEGMVTADLEASVDLEDMVLMLHMGLRFSMILVQPIRQRTPLAL
jgi:hypothetical protein